MSKARRLFNILIPDLSFVVTSTWVCELRSGQLQGEKQEKENQTNFWSPSVDKLTNFQIEQVCRNDVYPLQLARMMFFVVPNSYMELFGVPYITDISTCAPFYFFDGLGLIIKYTL